MPTQFNLMLLHSEIQLYKRFVWRMGLNPENSKWVVSLWLWFESVGQHNFITRASSLDDDKIYGLITESDACLHRCKSHMTGAASYKFVDIALPLISSLMAESLDLRFFDYHYDVVYEGVISFYEEMSIFFGKTITETVDLSSNIPKIKKSVEGSSQMGTALGARQWASRMLFPVSAKPMMAPGAQIMMQFPELPESELRMLLNPAARRCSQTVGLWPENLRSIFITFSCGHPLRRKDVKDFFNGRYGNCVEKGFIEKSNKGTTPVYGRVVFQRVSMIAMVLNGKPAAKFIVKEKDMWARIYK